MFDIKADNYEDYQKQVLNAANDLRSSGSISKSAFDRLEYLSNQGALELPIIANDKYEYYSIDSAPKFCAEMIAKVIIGKRTRKTTQEIAHAMAEALNNKIEDEIKKAIFGG